MTRILLVEDSKVQALVTRRLLENAGYTVEHAASAEEAVKCCYENAPDLVVSDQELGEVSGLEVCRRIKSDISLSVIPVLMLTGSQFQKHHVAALDAGADAFLSKESPPGELTALISRLVESTAGVQPLVAGREATGPARHRTRILVVDDSPTFLAMLCKKLSEAGFEVTGASSAAEALPLLEEQPFDVAVSDLVMPEMDGFEFAKRARHWAAENHRQLGLLVLTGTERTDVLVQSLDAGADDYVNKTQDLDVIVAHVTALARRIARNLQIEAMNQQAIAKRLELREAELQQQQAAAGARLADELEHANRALAEIYEQLRQFAHVASHDSHAPLRRLISSCELLQSKAQDKLDDEDRQSLQGIVQAAREMERLVGDLTRNSRPEQHD
jgi:DNA-binding response OmpR family regulator